ncbi:venom prothrombin activator oscutarin-C non-catalytic subunit-like [Amphiura filiformis]|uniref:venom prothrombin activator oscutarin-C non-catalytic subunit-like n=1 Tax=Amphiura filiformis TaxID=82378 RepID=UPI003B20DCC0
MKTVQVEGGLGGHSSCVSGSDRNTTSPDLWFTEGTSHLTNPINWNQNALDSLLDRALFCDKSAPIITNLPTNITQTTDPFSPTAIVNWTEPSVWDDSGSQTHTSSHMPGTMFHIGSTRVVYTSIDPSGNIATVEFFVTIIDIEKPILFGMPDHITKLSGHPNEPITWIEPHATDNSGVVTLTSSHGAGDLFPLGVTLVTYTAVDPSGNVEAGTFAIDIIECRSPLGMESGDIADSQITASTSSPSPPCCLARYARLHFGERWVADAADNNRWIKIELLYNYTLTGIIVQGWGSWTKSLSIRYEMPLGSGTLVNIKDEQGNTQIFQASKDGHTPVYIMFDEPIYTSIIQVEPKTCDNGIDCPMRLEILGCQQPHLM